MAKMSAREMGKRFVKQDAALKALEEERREALSAALKNVADVPGKLWKAARAASEKAWAQYHKDYKKQVEPIEVKLVKARDEAIRPTKEAYNAADSAVKMEKERITRRINKEFSAKRAAIYAKTWGRS